MVSAIYQQRVKTILKNTSMFVFWVFFIQFLEGVFCTVNYFYYHKRPCAFHITTPTLHLLFTLHNFLHFFSTHQNLFFSDIFRGFGIVLSILCVYLLFLVFMVLLYISRRSGVLFIKKQGDRSPENHRKTTAELYLLQKIK